MLGPVHHGRMPRRKRITLTIDDDVYAQMQRMRREDGLSPSAAINALARRGLVEGRAPGRRYVHHARAMHQRVDLTSIGEVLDSLDQPLSSR